MSLEDKLQGWTGPSSNSEQEKQERTERMVKQAINSWSAFSDTSLSVYAKGSYPNNTNVRSDSDVDIAVQCHELEYWEEAKPGVHTSGSPYAGKWTPSLLRSEVEKALRSKFGSEVDSSGSTAITVHSGSSRVDADVVPCFDYRYYFSGGGSRKGTRIVTKEAKHFENFPAQHLENGRAKNSRTSSRFKAAVRLLKRVENAMVEAQVHREVPSFLVESLVYNCPDRLFGGYNWTGRVRDILVFIWENTQGDVEPKKEERMVEVNECKYLFFSAQKWTRADARDFSKAAWNYLGYSS